MNKVRPVNWLNLKAGLGNLVFWLIRLGFKTVRADFERTHSRFLPAGDYVMDRWERAKRMGFSERVSIYDSSVVIGNVSVGESTWIGPFVVLDGSGGLSIGSGCSISAGVHIYTHDSILWALTGGESGVDRASVNIGKNCYLGPNVIVQKGVSIGDHSVVGANSFVRESIPSGSFAAGSPAKVLGPSSTFLQRASKG